MEFRGGLDRSRTAATGRLHRFYNVVAFALVIFFGSHSHGAVIDEFTLNALLDAVVERMGGLKIQFEGTQRDILRSRSIEYAADGVYDSYSGELAMRPDRAIWTDILHSQVGSPEIYRETLAHFRGRLEKLVRYIDSPSQLPTTGVAHPMDFEIRGSFARIVPAYVLRNRLLTCKGTMRSIGDGIVDGHRCEIVEFNLTPARSAEAKSAVLERFWIDIERDCCILLREYRVDGGQVQTRTRNVKVAEFANADHRIWLPTGASIERYGYVQDGKGIIRDTPVSVEDFYVISGSARIGESLPDEIFSANRVPGAGGNGALGGLRLRFASRSEGSSNSIASSEQSLFELVEEARRQGKELEASSAARSRPEWLDCVPWVIALASTALLAIVVARRKFVW
jgi:hypothetical protein